MDTMGRMMLRVAWWGIRRARDRLGFARLAILVRLCINQSKSEHDVNAAGEVDRVELLMSGCLICDLGRLWL